MGGLSLEAAAVKSLLYLGAMLVVGGAVTARWLAPGLVQARGKRLVTTLLLAGAVLLAGAALLDVAATLRSALGRVDGDLLQRYLATTRHGAVTRLRLALAPAVALLTVAQVWWRRPLLANVPGAPARWVGGLLDALLAAAALLLLYGFSSLSHAAAMGGVVPMWADLVHVCAAAAWAGPLGYLAMLRGWEGERAYAAAAFQRLSRVGLVAVAALALTGTLTALTQLGEPRTFVASAYGVSLGVKLALVLAVVVVAALNRYRHLPRFLAGGPGGPLRRAVTLEAVLLVAVFLATGALTTSALPHAADASTSAFENLRRLLELLRPR